MNGHQTAPGLRCGAMCREQGGEQLLRLVPATPTTPVPTVAVHLLEITRRRQKSQACVNEICLRSHVLTHRHRRMHQTSEHQTARCL